MLYRQCISASPCRRVGAYAYWKRRTTGELAGSALLAATSGLSQSLLGGAEIPLARTLLAALGRLVVPLGLGGGTVISKTACPADRVFFRTSPALPLLSPASTTSLTQCATVDRYACGRGELICEYYLEKEVWRREALRGASVKIRADECLHARRVVCSATAEERPPSTRTGGDVADVE